MEYNIKGTDLQITDELREYVEKRLSHADKFLHDDPTTLAEIELCYSEKNETGKYRAEFTLSMGGVVHRAESWGTTMHEAIDLGSAELIGELQRSKEKNIDEARHKAAKAKELLHEPEEEI